MMKALISVRLRALLAGLTKQNRQKNKRSKGMTVLFVCLYIYLIVVVAGMMCLTFSSLAPAYHGVGLDWLYFAMAGIMALGFSIFGSIFTTQSQLYDAKDNDMLLSMPIPPGMILLSRMLPLLGLNLLFGALVMVPAMVMWGVLVEFSLWNLVLQIFGMVGVCFLAQGAACLLGWGLHLLLQKMNKSAASLVFMVAFLAVYFGAYSQMGDIMNAMVYNAAGIASGVKGWVWPIYALGVGCHGDALHLLAFLAICGAVFGAVYWVLSATFLKSATSRRSVRRRKLDMAGVKEGNVTGAIINKEWRHFLGSPVYLTNMGIGIVMTLALAVAGVIFRGKLLEVVDEFAQLGLDVTAYIPLIICGGLSFLVSTMDASAPSVSLEGKNLWVLKSMPVSGREILLAKLRFYVLLNTPAAVLAGLVLSVAFGCGIGSVVLCAVVPGLLTVLGGILGLVCGLRWAKLDWLSEAYPCKQGAAVAVTMFSMMGVPVLLGALYYLLAAYITVEMFLALCALILAGASFGFYRLLMTWGVNKWEAL